MGMMLMRKDLGVTIETDRNFSRGVRLQPGGAIVACSLKGTAGVVALAVADGSVAYPDFTGLTSVSDMGWSPDGTLLALTTKTGVCVLAADRGGTAFFATATSVRARACCARHMAPTS